MAKTILRDIGVYKNRIISDLTSVDIGELLLNKEVSLEDLDDLIYSQIYPYLYVDETQTNVLSYICIEVNIPRIPTNTIKDLQLIAWIYSHKDCMKCNKAGYVGTRVDILSDMVTEILVDSNKYGIGKLNLTSAKNFFPSKSYYGRELVFTTSDFKRI